MTTNDVCCCYQPSCDKCAEIADQIYRLQHPEPTIRYCTGCGQDENHSHATSCATCKARYQQIIHDYIGKDVTLFSEDTKLMIWGVLHYHCAAAYSHLPIYLRPLCVDKAGYAYVQFKPDQIVNVHTYNQHTKYGNTQRAIQITIKL